MLKNVIKSYSFFNHDFMTAVKVKTGKALRLKLPAEKISKLFLKIMI